MWFLRCYLQGSAQKVKKNYPAQAGPWTWGLETVVPGARGCGLGLGVWAWDKSTNKYPRLFVVICRALGQKYKKVTMLILGLGPASGALGPWSLGPGAAAWGLGPGIWPWDKSTKK